MNKLNTRKAINPACRKHKPLRKEIDQMVYKLYELTEEEIAIVEGGV